MLAIYEDRVAGAESDLMAGLSEQDARTLGVLIGRLARNVHRTQPGASPCEAMDNL
jgi:hypothetical protein